MKTFPARLLCVTLLVAGCARNSSPPESTDVPPVGAPAVTAPAQRPNPASQNCIDKGGRLAIEKRPDGGEFGVCYFEDNHQCEEWALLRGECPVGGRRITGYATQAGRYCAITGGAYTGVVAADDSERGDCVLPTGKNCEAEAYYRGTCTR